MAQFRSLTEDEARMEFALAVLHESSSVEEVARVFKEAREGDVLPKETLDSLEIEAKELAPILGIEEDDAKLKKVRSFRDKLFLACNV